MNNGTIIHVPITLLCTANITPTQYTFLFLLHAKNWKAIREYVTANGGFPPHEVKDLHDRGYILYFKVNKNIETSAENFYVTERFTDMLYTGESAPMVDDDDAFNELHAAYPAYIQIDGKPTAARNLDFELGEQLYSRIIRGNRELHATILSTIAYGIEHGLLNMGMRKFIETRQWLSIQQAMEQGYQNQSFDNQEGI